MKSIELRGYLVWMWEKIDEKFELTMGSLEHEDCPVVYVLAIDDLKEEIRDIIFSAHDLNKEQKDASNSKEELHKDIQ